MKFKNPISFLILFLLISATCFSQSIVNRANSSYTVQDARLAAQYNLLTPRYADSTAANLQIGIDTCGAVVYLYSTHTFWYRSCASSTKKWVEIGSGGGSGADDSAYHRMEVIDDTTVVFHSNVAADTLTISGVGDPNLVVQRVGSGEQLHYVQNDTLFLEDIEGDGTYTSVTAQADSTKRISLTGIPVSYVIACSDETTDITTGTAKVTFRMPHAMTVTAVRASINTVSSSGTPTIDINESGTTILSTKITIDVSEKTSTTAATPPVISDSSLADDAEITIDIDVAGTGAKGLKVVITGIRTI